MKKVPKKYQDVDNEYAIGNNNKKSKQKTSAKYTHVEQILDQNEANMKQYLALLPEDYPDG